MQRVLVLLALVGLLFSPVAAAAAQRTCAAVGMPMAGMAVASSDNGQSSADTDPCCDRGPKGDLKACAQACAVMCSVVGVQPTAIVLVAPQTKIGARVEAALPWEPHPPPRTERPPRSIA